MSKPSRNQQRRWHLLYSAASKHPWHDLYRIAMLTKEAGSLEDIIIQAERQIAERSCELAGDNGLYAEAEREAMDDALYALRALRNAQKDRQKLRPVLV